MELLGVIDRYLKASLMPETKFGRLAVNDPRLVSDLRKGREPGPEMIARVTAFIKGQTA
ncbi:MULTISPECIES: hypothetical protein [Sphingomonas]|jgi:hypothetical protein|uniref:Transcriptional regulator n=1 Tax=Sphingomonas parapaucimobilis NBRC 15100 TaxID=1219049 RepID=A0A0A1WB87_9SPHN|nr:MULTISPECIES: hypothetical protein [Sphingomonas]GAM02648.1 hypothetical protein SP5_096_00080 [Sphingomonas parapaucimobilis NBRC 15100]